MIYDDLKNKNLVYVKSNNLKNKNGKYKRYCYSKSRFKHYVYEIAKLSEFLDMKLNNYFIEDNDYVYIIVFSKDKEFNVKVDKDIFYEKLINHSWSVCKKKKDKTYYCRSTINGKCVFLHRYILNLKNTDTVVDHINGNGLDNTLINLRECDISTNNKNIDFINKKGNIRGVRFRYNAWVAEWSKNGRIYSKSYNINKYGNEKAKLKAIKKRIKETTKLGFIYKMEDLDKYTRTKLHLRRKK